MPLLRCFPLSGVPFGAAIFCAYFFSGASTTKGRSYAADGSNEAEAAALRQALSRMIRKVDGSLEAHCPQAIDTGVLFTSGKQGG